MTDRERPAALNPRARAVIARRLACHPDASPMGAALAALDALAEAGYHLVTTPAVVFDPPEGTPEHDAVIEAVPSYAGDRRALRRVLSCEVDGALVSSAIVVSPLVVGQWRGDQKLRDHLARKQGHDLVAAVWRALGAEDPRTSAG